MRRYLLLLRPHTPALAGGAVLLGISAADCAAILLADAEAGVIGACHAGWRGTVAHIVERQNEAIESAS